MRPPGRTFFSTFRSIFQWLLELHPVRWLRDLILRAQHVSDASVLLISEADPIPPIDLGDAPLTILTANLWHDWPRFRNLPERLESLAQLIETQGAQVVLLQEALRTPDFSASAWLAERLDMAQVYVRANGHQRAIGFEEGPAVLTRFPFCEVRALQFQSSAGPFVRRMALGARVELGCCHVWAVSTHLGFLRRDNRRQIARLQAWVSEMAGEDVAVIGGDFNAGEKSVGIRSARSQWKDTYRQVHPNGDTNTHQLQWPWGGVLRNQRLDYLFLHSTNGNWQITDAQHLITKPLAHSDHKAVLTRLEHGQNHHTLTHHN